MRKLITALVAVALPFAGLFAQSSLRGRAVEKDSGIPEVGAVVSAANAAGQTAGFSVADSSGVFSIVLPEGDYTVTVSSMGRKDAVRSVSLVSGEMDLGDIELETDAQMLKGATVTDLKTLVKMDADKLSYDVEGDADAKASTLLDMLRKVPMVTVDAQDNITVNGSSDFKIYVDGKPDQMLSSDPSKTLKNIPASSIKNIEVITNPGAKYDAEGTGGVLNLTTNRSAGGASAIPDGVNGTVSTGVDTRGGVNGGLNLNARKGKLSFGTNIYAGHMHHPSASVLMERTDDAGAVLRQNMEGSSSSPYLWGSASLSYEIDSLNLLSAQIGLNRYGNDNDLSGTTSLKSGGTGDYSYAMRSKNGWNGGGFKGSIDWQRISARNKDRYLTLSYRYSMNPSKSMMEQSYSDFSGSVLTMPAIKSDQDDGSSEHTVQADYTTPLFKGHELNFGAKYIFRHNRADDLYFIDGVKNDESSSEYHHYNNIAAAYAEYKAVFGKFTATGGFRYEYTWQRVDFAGASDKNFDARFGSPVPNLSLQYNIGQGQNLAFTWNLRIRRPGIWVLNPFVERTPVSLSYGNSDIKPANTHRLEAKYNFFNPKWVVSARANYQFCNDGISSYSFTDADNLLNTTYGNILRQHRAGAGAYINWNASKKTRIYSNLWCGYVNLEADKQDLSNSGWESYASLGFQQTLPWDLRLSSNFWWSTDDVNLQGWSGDDSFLSLGLTKSFLEDRLNLSLMGMTNVSKGKARFEEYSEGAGFTMMSTTKIPLRSIRFEISWRFGRQGISVKRTNKTISNDDIEERSRSGSISGVESPGEDSGD